MQRYTVYFIWKLLYMFLVVPAPIIRSANNSIYSIWYLSHCYCYLPLAVTAWQIPDAVDTVVCALDDGWRYHPKHVEQFPDKLCNVASCWIYRVSQEECARLCKNVPNVKVHRYNPKHLYPKLSGYGDNGQRKVWSSCGSTYCTC